MSSVCGAKTTFVINYTLATPHVKVSSVYLGPVKIMFKIVAPGPADKKRAISRCVRFHHQIKQKCEARDQEESSLIRVLTFLPFENVSPARLDCLMWFMI